MSIRNKLIVFGSTSFETVCEMRSVVHFLNERNVKPADVDRRFCETYEKRAISDSIARRYVRNLNDGREDAHDDQRSGGKEVRGNRRFATSSFFIRFSQISRSWLHEIVSHRLGFRKLYSQRDTKTGAPLYDNCLNNGKRYVEKQLKVWRIQWTSKIVEINFCFSLIA